VSAQVQPGEAERSNGEWGVVISLEARLRAAAESALQGSGDDGAHKVTLEFVRQVLALPERQQLKLMAFLHLVDDPQAIVADLAIGPSGGIELRLSASAPIEA
jgi:hypothetical protein